MVLSSVVERFPDTEEAAGSSPVAPIQINTMIVNDFGKVCPDHVGEILKESISKIDTPRNYWVGVNDTPQNNLELYTFKLTEILHPHIARSEICGFEWWYHIGRTIKGVNPHFDCDEYRKMEEKVITTPMGCSITYLTDSVEAPTVITNVEPDWYPHEKFQRPTEVVYSFPGKGKVITFGPKYLHGIKTATLASDRITVMCNIWNYQPSRTVRVALVEELEDFDLVPRTSVLPRNYEGDCEPFAFNYFGVSASLPFPKEPQLSDTLVLNTNQDYSVNPTS